MQVIDDLSIQGKVASPIEQELFSLVEQSQLSALLIFGMVT